MIYTSEGIIMSKLTTDVAKQYILHGEAEALRGVLQAIGNIGTIDPFEEDDIHELATAYNDLDNEINSLYSQIEARLNKIEELVKNSG